jgi:Tol biopolymer transport system component
LNSYDDLTLTADSRAMVTIQSQRLASIWTTRQGDTTGARQLTFGGSNYEGMAGLAWTPDGRLVYSSYDDGNLSVWMVGADGSNSRQVTVGKRFDTTPEVSADGRYLVYVSNRTGSPNVWRMDIDGGNQKQLTQGNSDTSFDISSDSKWVVYSSGKSGTVTLWKASIEDSNAVRITDQFSFAPVISPDGKLVAFLALDPESHRFRPAVIPLSGGRITFLQGFPADASYFQWTRQGRALSYLLTRNDVSNVWSQPLEGGKAAQLTHFTSGLIFYYAWSLDGRQLAVSRGTRNSDVVLFSSLK